MTTEVGITGTRMSTSIRNQQWRFFLFFLWPFNIFIPSRLVFRPLLIGHWNPDSAEVGGQTSGSRTEAAWELLHMPARSNRRRTSNLKNPHIYSALDNAPPVPEHLVGVQGKVLLYHPLGRACAQVICLQLAQQKGGKITVLRTKRTKEKIKGRPRTDQSLK